MKVVIIGGGISGTFIARELSKYDLDITLIEKNLDIAWGTTKANSGILHAGYDDFPDTLRAKLCAKGNALHFKLSEELDYDVKRTGSLVVAFDEAGLKTLEELLKRGKKNNVPGLEILKGEEIFEKEPHLNREVKYALWAPTGGIIESWGAAIAAVENAIANGLKLILGEKVIDFERKNGRISKVITDKNTYEVDLVINAAGLYGDEIAKIAGAEFIPIYPRRGEYILLDKKIGGIVNSVIFPTPTEKSKGILVLPTIDGGILLGPTAEDLSEDQKENTATSSYGLKRIIEETKRLVPSLDISYAIKTFAGIRAENPNKDFFIKESEKIPNFINVIGIRSPGLTAAPAIATYVVEEIIQDRLKINLEKKKTFISKRERIKRYSELPLEEWNEEIKKDPLSGKIICYCNMVTEREILEAIRRGARSLDGVKFRTRASFGRCQGNFCGPRILEILARELNKDLSEITAGSEKAWILNGRVRP
ncbi:MAG TPA: NAD(P)/FAD-dependent oxidoreductase [Dictyoglomaceae bacterium]|nr:NAD(P)/FAD-dependent oxidoreductase [Dictyoglomaceae bacterium]